MVDDSVLSEEAGYIYSNSTGFEPVKGNLLRWEGILSDSTGTLVKVYVDIPDNFPDIPPSITIDPSYSTPITDAQGKLYTRSMRRWRRGMHVHQILKEVELLLKQVKTTGNEETQKYQNAILSHENSLQRQINQLKERIQTKQVELSSIKSNSQPVTQLTSDVLKQSMSEIEAELFSLEDEYDKIEISDTEFARKFVRLRKKYYLIESAVTSR